MADDPTRTDPKAQAALALHRFGFGPRAGTIAAIAGDPRGALLADLDRPAAGRIAASVLRSSGEAARAAFNFRQEREAERLVAKAQKAAQDSQPNMASTSDAPGKGDMPTAADPEAMKQAATAAPKLDLPQQIYLDEAKARVDAALSAEIGFAERLVWFWSNHFCVSADKVPALAGAYEREAIREHALGRFADLLLAVESHPAMLVYLDNAQSIGPDSIAGINRGKGLNENLAREILELHTLGVRTGYGQGDVTTFANVITGWTVLPPRQNPDHGGEFVFNPRMHEPGGKTVLGQNFSQDGIEQGRAVLAMLARHPATAHHVAEKLARHFIADIPPPPLVERLAKRMRDTEGDLKEVARTLLSAPEAWAVPTKLKRPSEWIIGALRAVDVAPPDIRPMLQAQRMLGEPLWRPPAPKGFPDDEASWRDGLAERLDIANQLARRVAATVDPDAVLDATLGPSASTVTREAIGRAESRPQALAMLFMAPEFLRR